MSKTYAVLGSGMQGTAAAYDIAKFGDPQRILVADVAADRAQASADRVNRLTGRNVCVPEVVDATDTVALAAFLAPVDVLVSAVPYHLQPPIVPVALKAGTSMVDMGNDTADTFAALEFDALAKQHGVAFVPDTGLAPGLVNSLGNYIIEEMDSVESVKLYCGGLPQHPKPPFDYMLVFSIEGLVGEYTDETIALRNGEIVAVDTLCDVEALEVEGLGAMEAFTTSGGTSTSPYTWQGKVRDYEYKTVRYPGHCEKMRVFKDCGFWSLDPICVGKSEIVPRDLFHTLMGPALADSTDRDLVVTRAVGVGKSGGRRCRIQMDILDVHDGVTGFSAMERLTGFSAAIVAEEIAAGRIAPGCWRYEHAMTGHAFVEQLQRRGLPLTIRRDGAN